MNGDLPTNRGCGYNFRTFLIVVPFVAVQISMFAGITMGLTGGNADEIAQGMLAGLRLVFIVAAFFCIVYAGSRLFLLLFDQEMEPVFLDWRTILASANIGAALFTLFCALSTPDMLDFWTVTNVSFLEDPIQQILFGGLFGWFAGSVIGMGICVLDSKATHFTREGITRYVVWLVLFVGVLAIIVAVSKSSKIGSALSPLITLFVLDIAKSGVRKLLDKRGVKNNDVES